MRSRIILACLLLSVTSYAAELRLEPGTAKVNEPVALNVNLTSAADALTGVQFDLEYDLSALDVTVEIGPAADKAGKVVQSSILEKARQRVLIIGFNRDTMTDGTVAVLHVAVKASADSSKTYPVHLTATAGTNANAEAIAVTGRDVLLKAPSIRNSK